MNSSLFLPLSFLPLPSRNQNGTEAFPPTSLIDVIADAAAPGRPNVIVHARSVSGSDTTSAIPCKLLLRLMDSFLDNSQPIPLSTCIQMKLRLPKII